MTKALGGRGSCRAAWDPLGGSCNNFLRHVCRPNNCQYRLPEIGREQWPGSDQLGQFFVSECHRLTIGVIFPLPGYSHVLEQLP
jgi:hypothetical protein